MSILIANNTRMGRMTAYVAAAIAMVAVPALADTELVVPNHSFESPVTLFAWPDATEWDQSGPESENPLDPTGPPATLDTGVFLNSPGDFFITNADGSQLGYIGAKDDDDIAFFQQTGEVYEVGAVYTLRLDVGESSFPPLTYNINDPDPPPNPEPALLALQLYCEGGNRAHVIVAEHLISADVIPNGEFGSLLLVEFSVISGAIPLEDACANEPLGVEIRPHTGLGGIWNVDNARLSVNCGPAGVSGDTDLDGILDLDDHALFAQCMTGPLDETRPQGCPPCAFERLHDDLDIDLRDYAALAAMFGS